ncbi:hypothetical protein L207DRAFT_586843 [Hyaloscypha variabilis F]|uniref:Uncharacterized protein n=1 Tax=Hyaloscypha variabilis (strain UAMH 11265 / GT02V1 / F) TaxID=1149755 RepID=A0A2J6RBD3_HYAVF|nr:hypothetical protein L207DRAFT_586843 [Hyaloscypha variabilis F]
MLDSSPAHRSRLRPEQTRLARKAVWPVRNDDARRKRAPSSTVDEDKLDPNEARHGDTCKAVVTTRLLSFVFTIFLPVAAPLQVERRLDECCKRVSADCLSSERLETGFILAHTDQYNRSQPDEILAPVLPRPYLDKSLAPCRSYPPELHHVHMSLASLLHSINNLD